MAQLPPRPPGDVAATQAMIRTLQSDRQGVVAMRRAVVGMLDGTSNLSGMFMLPVTAYRVAAVAEVDAAIAGVDAAIASASAAVRRLERDLAAWRAECARIQAASP